jgi:hypothetical protein
MDVRSAPPCYGSSLGSNPDQRTKNKDPGCLSRIRDPSFSIRIQGQQDSESRIRIKELLRIFNPKSCSKLSENELGCSVHPGSGFFPSRIQWSKKHRIPVRNTDFQTSLKNRVSTNRLHKQRSAQHNLARQRLKIKNPKENSAK